MTENQEHALRYENINRSAELFPLLYYCNQ